MRYRERWVGDCVRGEEWERWVGVCVRRGEECEECYIVHYIVYYEFIGEKQGISLHESQEQIQRGSGAKGPRPKNWKCRPAPLPLGKIPAIAPAPAESAPEIGEHNQGPYYLFKKKS